MASAAVKVTMRQTPCKCGCGGRDPWHAASLVRVVRNLVEVPGEDGLGVLARGEVEAPWGLQAVQLKGIRRAGVVTPLGWEKA